MASQHLSVLVSVLNWNGGAKTLACLQALAAVASPDFHVHVVVVDNASRDGSPEHIRAAYPDIEMIHAPENLGYAGGNWLALQRALETNADLFWILNNDALPQTDALSTLVDAFRVHGEALYGSVPVYGDHNTWRIGMNTQSLENSPPSRVRTGDDFARIFTDLHTRRVTILAGNSLLIPLAVVRTHGFIDLDFFLYSEETDYCLRLAHAGVPSLLVPRSVVVHQPRGAHKHNPRLKAVITYYQVRNRLILKRRYTPLPAYAFALLQHSMFVLAWLALSIRRGPDARRVARFTALGIRDALLGRMGKTFAPEDDL